MSGILQQIGIGVVTSLIAALITAAASLLISPIRYLVFYKSREYELEFDTDFDKCK